jgi:putative FmdB family regulatory protein
MPFYEYECPHCGHREEVLQSINDKPLKKCPNCGKNGLRKLMSAPVFRLKGSGWYETDFKSDKDKQRNLAGPDREESKSETKTEAKADSNADSKTDSKAESKPDTKSDSKSDSKSEAKAPAPKADPKSKVAKRSPPKKTTAKGARKPRR